MRYLIKFTKEPEIKFISHLDIMRTIQRSIRRSGLPVEYSKGFNPHMSISIAQPLPVGMYSKGEYMDVVFTENVDTNEVKKRLNENMPNGINVVSAAKIPSQLQNEKKSPQSMAVVDGAKYNIKIKYKDTSKLAGELKELIQSDDWSILKKTKSGEKVTNIKPMIKDFRYSITDNELVIKALLSCGSRENLSAELLSKFIKNNTHDADEISFVDIERIELLGLKKNEYVSLIEALTF